jgi:flagellar biosynthesis protein FlhG
VADFRVDQAAGLRRLFGRNQLRVFSFVAGCAGVGRTLTVANLAVAMARRGREVLIVDENSGVDDIAAVFGMQTPRDLQHLLDGRCELADILVQPTPGVSLLPASRAVSGLGGLSHAQQQSLLDGITTLERPIDVILVDCSLSHPAGFSPFGLLGGEIVVTLTGKGDSITQAYALIKRLSTAYARRDYRILVGKVKCRDDAAAIFSNIAQVAAQRRVATLSFAGAIPQDETLRICCRLCQPVVTSAPDTEVALALRELASEMLYWPSAEYDKGGVEQFMQQLLHLSQRMNPTVISA